LMTSILSLPAATTTWMPAPINWRRLSVGISYARSWRLTLFMATSRGNTSSGSGCTKIRLPILMLTTRTLPEAGTCSHTHSKPCILWMIE
jgi:hypothetical protein